MLETKALEELLGYALSNGGDLAEIFMEDGSSTFVALEDNRIEKVSSGREIGAGVRVISGGEISYASTTDTSFFGLKTCAFGAARGIKEGNRTEPRPLVPAPPPPLYTGRRPESVPMDEKIHVAEKLNKEARSFGEKIKQVSARVMDSNRAVTIANSDGLYVEDNRIHTRYYVHVTASDGNALQTGIEAPGGSVGYELIGSFPPEAYARKAAERAIMMLSAPHAPSGKMTVIMSSEGGSTLIHEACGHSLEADFILKGTSVFSGRLGKKVASDIVTVVDDAAIPGGFGSFHFDDEGTPAERKALIENGILKCYLNDRFTARGLQMKLSGNGRRESFRTRPVPRMTNTHIARGTSDPREIIDSVSNGLLVKRMGGGEVNVQNGDFVFEVSEGYLIENGKAKHPVKGAMLTGNGPKVLELIDMVGSDLGFQEGVCGKTDHVPVSHGQPTIRVPELVVGGR